MHVHHVEVEKPALVAVGAQEFERGVENVAVVPVERDVGVLETYQAGALAALGARAEVDLEALGEAEVRIDPAVSPDARGPEARLLEDLRGHAGLRGDHVVGAQHARSNRIQPGPQGGHRALRPGRLGNLLGEADTGRREGVEVRAGIALVAVDTEPVRPQRVDEDEQHVQVAALPQREQVLERASGARAS